MRSVSIMCGRQIVHLVLSIQPLLGRVNIRSVVYTSDVRQVDTHCLLWRSSNNEFSSVNDYTGLQYGYRLYRELLRVPKPCETSSLSAAAALVLLSST